MGEILLTLCFFLFVMASTGAILMLFRWTAEPRLRDGSIALPEKKGRNTLASGLAEGMFVLGALIPGDRGGRDPFRNRLQAAGFRSPHASAIFQGTKIATALALALTLGWIGLLDKESLPLGLLLAVCGAGFGFLLPDRVLESMVRRRTRELERALPNALDLLVLGVEAGQSLDSALADTSRELRAVYPELSSEFAQVQVEARAGRSKAEVLHALGQRTQSKEIRKLATVLADTERFGTSLGPTLRTHARYLRTRRRLEAQESARKLSAKLVFPVFFLIMPSVFIVTLGPAVLTFFESISTSMGI
ncbi:MAG: type II secretion system F family protein [Acidobacteria bacterium]|nr:type II secretion system F family protein [Acidobacteriota bacterium]